MTGEEIAGCKSKHEQITAPITQDLQMELPWPYKGLSPNDRLTPRHKRRVKNQYKSDCFYLVKSILGKNRAFFAALSDKDEVNLDITLHPTNARWDEDNGIAAFKYGQDGLALALGVDDNKFRVRREWGAPVKGGKVIVRVSV